MACSALLWNTSPVRFVCIPYHHENISWKGPFFILCILRVHLVEFAVSAGSGFVVSRHVLLQLGFKFFQCIFFFTCWLRNTTDSISRCAGHVCVYMEYLSAFNCCWTTRFMRVIVIIKVNYFDFYMFKQKKCKFEMEILLLSDFVLRFSVVTFY